MQSLSRIGLMSLTYATAAVVVDSDPLDAVVPVDVVVVVTVLGEAGEAEAPPHAVKMIATCELGFGAWTWSLLRFRRLLFGERRLEHRFLDVRLQVAVRLIDERIAAAGL